MSHQVANHLIAHLSNRARIDSDLLLEALLYVEASNGREPSGVDPQLEELLSEEKFTPEISKEIKRLLVNVLVEEHSTELVVSAARVLQEFRDQKIAPILTVLLDRHLRLLLEHNRAVSQLLFALADCGAPVGGVSRGIGTVELNIEIARRHLCTELGLVYPG